MATKLDDKDARLNGISLSRASVAAYEGLIYFYSSTIFCLTLMLRIALHVSTFAQSIPAIKTPTSFFSYSHRSPSVATRVLVNIVANLGDSHRFLQKHSFLLAVASLSPLALCWLAHVAIHHACLQRLSVRAGRDAFLFFIHTGFAGIE